MPVVDLRAQRGDQLTPRGAAMIETALFDCWGTLIQAPNLMRRGVAAELVFISLTAMGCDIDFEAFRDAYIVEARRQHEEAQADFREIDYLRRIYSTLGAIGLQHPHRRLLAERAWADYLAEWPKQSTPYEETPMLLSSIKGRYKLGLVTNFPDGPTARKTFENFCFFADFESLVVSGEVGFRKPNRVMFERALSELESTPERTVMIGDTFATDIVGAKNVGMKAILIDAIGVQIYDNPRPDAVVTSIGQVDEVLRQM